MRVNILGSNLSGLLAAHAAVLYGHSVRVLESDLWGEPEHDLESVAILKAVPNTFSTPVELRSMIVGDEAAWHEKARAMSGEIQAQGLLRAWNPNDLFTELDDRYGWDRLERVETVEQALDADLVVSADAALALCELDDCAFLLEDVYRLPISKFNANTENYMVGSGYDDDWWHTAWSVGGSTGSYVQAEHATLQNAQRLVAPCGTSCECHPEVLRVGKFGTWDANEPTVDAFFKTVQRLQELS